MEHPAGETGMGDLQVNFDRRLRLEFHGSRNTSDAGLLAFRELDDALDVADPAGKDQAAYDACAQELWEMALALAVLLGPDA